MPRRGFHVRNQARYRRIEAENAQHEIAKADYRRAHATTDAVKQSVLGDCDQRDPIEMARAGSAALRAAVA